ncbi:XRE family transcriptional regulator [Pleurocapsales cyanobacterium LEGE 10410]|nr:XRE family transcriptional regulator [Pleurocapsales cyanobacterium LEGE 10410]
MVQNQLRRRINCLVDSDPNCDQITWVNYFVEIIRDSSRSELEKRLAYWHLLAYLDLDRCYLIWRNFRKLPFYIAKSQEIYDFTNNLLFQPDKFYKHIDKYNAHDISGANFKTYILSILRNAIREKLELKSSWRVLCDVEIDSHKKFDRALRKRREALERYGIPEPQRSRYVFALRHFILVYKTNRIYNSQRIEGSRWPEPELADFAEAANFYNSQRFTINAPLQATAGGEVSPETIKKWINICLKALRYNHRIIDTCKIDSYERYIGESSIWSIKESESADLLQQTDLILRKTTRKIEGSFAKIRSKIPQQFRQSIMPLCYSHGFALLNQEKLGHKIGVHQGTISRYIYKNFEVPLLKQFQQFANERINPELYLTIFLEKRFTNPKFSNLLDVILIEAIRALDSDAQKILKYRYSQQMNVADIADVLNSQQLREPQEVELILAQARNKLQEELLEQLGQWQAKYVRLWLKKYYQEMFQTVLLTSFRELNSGMQEILHLRYCQRMDEHKITSLYPDVNPAQVMVEAKQQLQYSVLYWVAHTWRISLVSENQQVMEMVENWLSQLIYIDL